MRLVSTLSVLVLAASPLLADVVSPVYSQLVAVPTPANFVAAFENAQDGSYILELIPEGEAVENWTQMITITGAKDAAKRMTPGDFLVQITKGFKAACPDTLSGNEVVGANIKGAVSQLGVYLACGSLNGQSQQVMMFAIQGDAEIYSVQWAERGPVSTEWLRADLAIWSDRLSVLSSTRICDRVTGEKSPFASCTQ